MRHPHRGGDPGVHPFCPTTLARAADAAGKRSDQPCGTAHREERDKLPADMTPHRRPVAWGSFLTARRKPLTEWTPPDDAPQGTRVSPDISRCPHAPQPLL